MKTRVRARRKGLESAGNGNASADGQVDASVDAQAHARITHHPGGLSNLVYFSVKMRSQPDNAGRREGGGWKSSSFPEAQHGTQGSLDMTKVRHTPQSMEYTHRTVHAPLFLDLSYHCETHCTST